MAGGRGAMLSWTALGLALSLRLALARSGAERGECAGGRPGLPFPPPARRCGSGQGWARRSRRSRPSGIATGTPGQGRDTLCLSFPTQE